MNYHREIANQTLKNQITGNVKIRCRLEKDDKTGKPKQAGDTKHVTPAFATSYAEYRAPYSFTLKERALLEISISAFLNMATYLLRSLEYFRVN
jgi:hypothetical protein